VVAEGLLVAGRFLEKYLALGRVLLVVQPGQRQLRSRQPLSQCQFA